ncbi:MAG: GPW/gp25 family protein [Bryobacterales bacterium]|nr:GPW/gp25 family protein [Bryobacterales bacterium]
MPGTNAETGKDLTGLAHLRQSVRDILTTPIGTRVMRREYGSRLFELLDAPLTPATMTEIYAAAAEALARWEPRLRVDRIAASPLAAGNSAVSQASEKILIDIYGAYLPDGEAVRIEGLVI